MSVDKFGHYSSSLEKSVSTGPPANRFKRTKDGDFNMENKRIVNLARPTDDDDACTKHYVFLMLEKLHNKYIEPVKTSIDAVTANIKEIKDEIIPSKVLKFKSDIQIINENTNSKVQNITKVIPEMIQITCGKMQEDLKLFISDKSEIIQKIAKTSADEEIKKKFITIQTELQANQERVIQQKLQEYKDELVKRYNENKIELSKHMNMKEMNIIKVIPEMIAEMRNDLKLFINAECTTMQKDIKASLDAKINEKYNTIQKDLLNNQEKNVKIIKNKLHADKDVLIE